MSMLTRIRADFSKPDAPKPSHQDVLDVVSLTQQLEVCQARIAAHRKRLPPRKRRAKLQGSSKPAAPSHEEAELDESGAEDAEAPGTITDGDSLEAQSE